MSGGEAPQQFTRASRHKRQIVFFAKPCPFVRHKFHRTNSGKNKIQVLVSRFSPKEKRARSRARSSRRPPQRAKDLIRSKSAGKSEFFSRKAAKKEGKPSPGVFPKKQQLLFCYIKLQIISNMTHLFQMLFCGVNLSVLLYDFLAAHVRSESDRNTNAAVSIDVVFYKRNQSTGRSKYCVVESRNKICTLFALCTN